MSAEIIDFVEARASRVRELSSRAFMSSADGLSSEGAGCESSAFQFWTGASGVNYVHSVFDLIECPPFDTANYVLVKRHVGGQRTVMAIGRAVQSSPTLNLAEIRQRGAQLGANEVHVHLLAGGLAEGKRIEADLRDAIALA